MKSIEQDGVTALLLSEAERRILKKVLEDAKTKLLSPAETAIVEVAIKFLTRVAKMPQ
jgi:hypothetical protein